MWTFVFFDLICLSVADYLVEGEERCKPILGVRWYIGWLIWHKRSVGMLLVAGMNATTHCTHQFILSGSLGSDCFLTVLLTAISHSEPSLARRLKIIICYAFILMALCKGFRIHS